MSTETHNMVARDQLRAFIERVERVEEEIATLNTDKSDIYKEARAVGFDVKVLRKVVAKRKLDTHVREEQDAIFDMYWDALYGAPVHVHTHARENIEEFPASDPATNGRGPSLTTREAEESVVSVSEKATVATQGEATAPTSDERVSLPVCDRSDAAANTGGEHVESSGKPAGLADPTSNTGEGAANTALPADSVKLEYVPPTGMKRLPVAHCFPELSKAEYERLEKDIVANRVREPIIRQGDVIVDGWARYNISRAYGMSYPVQELDNGHDVLLDVIEWQRAARNFTPAQEKKIAADLAKEIPHRAGDIMAAFGLAEALEVA